MATQTQRTTPQPPAQASVLKVKTNIKAGFNPQPDPPGAR
jgi:hypothetical protein